MAGTQTYLIVDGGTVVNAVVWDGNTENWAPPNGRTAVPLPDGSSAWIGWNYDGKTFSAPETSSPT